MVSFQFRWRVGMWNHTPTLSIETSLRWPWGVLPYFVHRKFERPAGGVVYVYMRLIYLKTKNEERYSMRLVGEVLAVSCGRRPQGYEYDTMLPCFSWCHNHTLHIGESLIPVVCRRRDASIFRRRFCIRFGGGRKERDVLVHRSRARFQDNRITTNT